MVIRVPAGWKDGGRCLSRWLLVGLLSACAGWLGPRVVIVSDAELSQRLAERFPIERRWLELFDLRLSNPRVSTDASSGRLRVEVDIRVGQRLIGKELATRLQLLGKPRYEASDHSIRITDVSVDALQVNGSAESILGRVGAWPSTWLAQVLEDRTIYQLSARQLTDLERQGLVLRRLEIGARGLALHFDPT